MIKCDTIGQSWIKAMKKVVNEGNQVEDYLEVLNLQISFNEALEDDDIIIENDLISNIEEMKKVFFSKENNKFGHSYYDVARGPYGNKGIEDIVRLLKEKSTTKRATIFFNFYGPGDVPCINVIHFLIREQGLIVNYFSRGQDMYKKFACDGICIAEMGKKVAEKFEIPLIETTGTISSAHIYKSDLEKVNSILNNY